VTPGQTKSYGRWNENLLRSDLLELRRHLTEDFYSKTSRKTGYMLDAKHASNHYILWSIDGSLAVERFRV
jgi:hypothetical protein